MLKEVKELKSRVLMVTPQSGFSTARMYRQIQMAEINEA